ncbi:MAG: heme exporter protein CcmB, partial [Ilumatobacteraceae bacterium]
MAEVSRFDVAKAVFVKDLRVEIRSRVLVNQILPFSALVMVLFAFALDATNVLTRVAPGLIWLAVLFSMIVIVQRGFAVESADGALEALQSAGVDALGVYWGKWAALVVQLVVLEVLLVATAVLLYGVDLRADGVVLLVTTSISATCGLAAVGTIYGGLAAGGSGREPLRPRLVLPGASPVRSGAPRAGAA